MDSVITFPNLGISVNPSRVAFSLFGKDIYWYGIIIAVGFLLAVIYTVRRAPEFGLTEDNILDMLIASVPAAIIFARIYYCIFNWSLYRDDPVSCLYIWNGGIAIYGGVIGGVLGLWLYSRAKKMKMWPLLDVGGLGLLIGQLVGRWGNFINREAHGTETDAFFKMGLTDESGTVRYYHPTFLYESVWNLIGFILLHFYSKKHRHYDGEIFTMYVAWYGLGRGFIEGLRTDSLYLFNTGIRVSQLLGFLSCLAAVFLLVWNLYLRPHDPKEMRVNRVAAQAAADAAAAEAPEDESGAAETPAEAVPEEETPPAESGAQAPGTEDGEDSSKEQTEPQQEETAAKDAES